MAHPRPLPPADVVRDALDYDPETGHFTWKKRTAIRLVVGDRAGHIQPDGYRRIGVYGQSCPAHRLAFVFMTGSDPPGWVDHIDGDKDNNRWANLRAVSQAENLWNIAMVDLYKTRKVSSRYTGVSLIKLKSGGHKWGAAIMRHGKHHWLGSFWTEEEARDAYVAAKRALHR